METDVAAVLAIVVLIAGVVAGVRARRRHRPSWPWFLGGALGFFILVGLGGAM